MSQVQATVSFIVSALNEEQNLPPLFERLLAVEEKLGRPCEILVVDDSSTDRTFQVAEAAARVHPQIRTYRKPLPRGLGRGIRTGIERARGEMGVIVMADGVDPLEEALPEFCKKTLEDGCHLVLLSRYIKRYDSRTIPVSYKIYHSMFRFLTLAVLGLPYPDTTYAFRGFNLKFIRGLNLRSDGFEISPEITFKTYFSGGRIGQVSGRQTSRVHGKSKFRFLKVAPGYARVFAEGLGMRWNRAHHNAPVEAVKS